MAKFRLTDIEKWQPWFRKLPMEQKLFWFFLCDFCDNAGVWERDDEVARLYVGSDLDLDKAVKAFNEGKQRIAFLKDGSKWLLTGFIKCQHPKGLDLNAKAQTAVFKDLAKNGLDPTPHLKGDFRGYPEAMEESLEPTDRLLVIDKVKDKEKGIVKGFQKPSLEDLKAFFREKGFPAEAEKFFDYYEANGWRVGRNPMKKWPSAAANWLRNGQSFGSVQKHPENAKPNKACTSCGGGGYAPGSGKKCWCWK